MNTTSTYNKRKFLENQYLLTLASWVFDKETSPCIWTDSTFTSLTLKNKSNAPLFNFFTGLAQADFWDLTREMGFHSLFNGFAEWVVEAGIRFRNTDEVRQHIFAFLKIKEEEERLKKKRYKNI